VREEHRFEKTSGSFDVLAVRSCPSMRATLRFLVEGFDRRAEIRERPAGPPPMQTTS
jgi:hypothetical protein